MGRCWAAPLGHVRLRELAERRLRERRRGAPRVHRPPDTTPERHGMTTAAPRTSSSDWPVYAIVALGAAIAVSDGALYAATRVVGDRPTPGSPSALVRALQAGYRPTTPVLVLASVLLLALLSAAAIAAGWLVRRRGAGALSDRARWAKPAELRSLQVPADVTERESVG